MSPIQISRAAVLGIVALFNVVLVAPITAHAQENPVDAPVAAAPAQPSWDETSGYGAVEATRAAISGPTWDEASGYGSVETTRAINALPDESVAVSSLVPSDVRWATAPATAPMPSLGANSAATAVYEALAYGPSGDDSLPSVGANSAATAVYAALAYGPSQEEMRGSPSVEESRVIAAQQALLSGDLGSLQEEALMAIVAAAVTWDETSGYGAVEASRAAISGDGVSAALDATERLAQFRAIELSLSRSLGTESDAAPLARGTRAESAVLWTILNDDADAADSDDRIANALFGAE